MSDSLQGAIALCRDVLIGVRSCITDDELLAAVATAREAFPDVDEYKLKRHLLTMYSVKVELF